MENIRNTFTEFTAEAFLKSLGCALSMPCDFQQAYQRTHRRIAKKPESTLNIKRHSDGYQCYEYKSGKQIFIKKSSERLYLLARYKYLELLEEVIKLRCRYDFDDKRCREAFAKIEKLITKYELAHLDMARIVLTQRQYKWYSGKHKVKKANEDDRNRTTKSEIAVRSKSEKSIGNALERLAVPYIYENQMRINVSELVKDLEKQLRKEGALKGPLFQTGPGGCHWNVPAELEWMNSRGSLWKSYDYICGCVTLFPDFHIMLNDGTFIIWEHEGLADDFIYRINAGERIFIMRLTDSVKDGNLIYTFEHDINDSERLQQIIIDKIVSRMWF